MSSPSPITTVPSELLQAFISQCIASMQAVTVNPAAETLSQLRQSLLQLQRDCLERVVSNWNNTCSRNSSSHGVTTRQLQEALQNSLPHRQQLDQAARLAFVRLVLLTASNTNTDDKNTNRQHIRRNDLLEFCGLCMAAVQLPLVQQYLAHGNSKGNNLLLAHLEENNSDAFDFPQDRLERIQQHFWKALGYDVPTVKSELHRLFFQSSSSSKDNEFTKDTIVQSNFSELVTTMNAAIVTATHQAQEHAMSTPHSDDTTRVVSVQYSESLVVVDAATGKQETVVSSSHIPPTPTLPIAAEQLQQEIWAELLSMRDEQRQEKLDQAAALARHVQETALEMSDWKERKEYLQSMNVESQKQLIMHKLWQDWIQKSGGVEPSIRYQST